MPYSLSTLLVLVLLLAAGCGSGDRPKFTEAELALLAFPQREGLPEPSGGFALAVGEQTVTSDEIVAPLVEQFSRIAQSSSFEQFKEQARPKVERVLLAKVSDILIFQQARKQAGEHVDEAVEGLAEREVRKFVVGFGGDYARAEQALKRMGMDWADFKEYQKRIILSQSYIASQLPRERPVSYSQLLDCYNDMKDEFFVTPAMIKFRLIDIQPAKLPRPSEGRDLAAELVERLQAGEDFASLARQYSHGHRASFGGLWKPVQPDSLAKPYDVLAAQVKSIEPRQIAGPIVPGTPPEGVPKRTYGETAEHIFIMRLEEKRQESVEPFEKVQSQVKANVIFDRRKEAVDKLSARLVQQARLGRKNEFIDFCLKEIYQICNQ